LEYERGQYKLLADKTLTLEQQFMMTNQRMSELQQQAYDTFEENNRLKQFVQ